MVTKTIVIANGRCNVARLCFFSEEEDRSESHTGNKKDGNNEGEKDWINQRVETQRWSEPREGREAVNGRGKTKKQICYTNLDF